MAKKRYYSDSMSGLDGRRRMEAEGAAMIKEDKSAVANLPQDVVMREYPKNSYDHYDLNDDIKGIDVQMKDDVSKERRKKGQAYPEKW